MKTTIIKTILAGITAAIVLTGCGATSQPSVKFPEKSVRVFQWEDGTTQFNSINPIKDNRLKDAASYITQLKEAAYYGKSKGFSYFTIVNDDFNNMMGLPVNTTNDFLSYCSGYSSLKRWHGHGCELHGMLKVMFLKENPMTFPVWNIDSTINEVIDLSDMAKLIHKEGIPEFISYLESNSIPYKN